MQSFLAGCLLVVIFGVSSCTTIQLQEQFVAGKQTMELSRSDGSCDDMNLSGWANSRGAGQSLALGGEVSVLSWNVFKGLREGWQEDLQNIGRGSDLVLLQEAPLSGHLLEFFRQEALYWQYNSAFRYKGVETGVVAASSIPSLASCGMRQDEPITGFPKTALLAAYEIEDSPEKLLVANIHSINITLGTASYRAQLDSLKEMLHRHRGPLLVVGDFNTWNGKRAEAVDALVADLALTRLEFEEEGRTKVFGQVVDHIFYRGVEPLSGRIFPVTSSDHNPLKVIFRVSLPGATSAP